MVVFEMGSKKLKRKKLKFKKIEKFLKLKTVKKAKRRAFKKTVEKDFDKSLHTKSITCSRSNKNNYALSYDESEDISEIKNFSRIRENYFLYLQTVICDNCAFYDSVVTEETLKDLALELEQNALLACLQVDIYKKSMCKIIKDIKKSTEEKQVHEEVRKLLPESTQEKNDNKKSDKSTLDLPEIECYSRIPTIDSTRTDEDLMKSTNFWSEESGCNSDYYLVSDREICNENQNLISVAQPCVEIETYPSAIDYCDHWNIEITKADENNINKFDTIETLSQSSCPQHNVSDLNQEDNVLPKEFNNNSKSKIDPLLLSRINLQKLVELTLKETEKIQKQKRDEEDRAHIAQILEGDDSLDNNLNDSLSDNENESKENIDESNLMDRLEKMRELFGVEEEGNSKNIVIEKPKPNTKHKNINSHSHHLNSWRYEKFIQLYKYSLIAGEMSCEKRIINQEIFLQLFGEDSDEEHEKDYSSEEKYRASCVERISSWVVKYLMPFYHDKRILGRNVFKTLGHHISDTIVDVIQYPDEWTVKYFVSKFFPPKKKYTCDADVLNFQPD